MNAIQYPQQRQRGAALIVSLIMLVMVSLLAAAGFLATTGEARGAAGWSDRQRALFLAETTLREAVSLTQSVVDANRTRVKQAVLAKGATQGFFVRDDDTFNILPWNEKTFNDNSATFTNLATQTGLSGAAGRYAIVFEGMVSRESGGVVGGAGSTSQTAQRPRFTIYAKAGGQRDGTLVVLSTSKEFQ